MDDRIAKIAQAWDRGTWGIPDQDLIDYYVALDKLTNVIVEAPGVPFSTTMYRRGVYSSMHSLELVLRARNIDVYTICKEAKCPE